MAPTYYDPRLDHQLFANVALDESCDKSSGSATLQDTWHDPDAMFKHGKEAKEQEERLCSFSLARPFSSVENRPRWGGTAWWAKSPDYTIAS